jgi:hypothetical protein
MINERDKTKELMTEDKEKKIMANKGTTRTTIQDKETTAATTTRATCNDGGDDDDDDNEHHDDGEDKQDAPNTVNMMNDSFLCQFELWQFMTKKMKLPLPPVKRILPMVFAEWNADKGGSDTISGLLKEVMPSLPVQSAQAGAVAQMIMMGDVAVHRLRHMFSAKPNLAQGYPSLHHYRNANNQRSSFHDMLIDKHNVLLTRLKQNTAVASMPPAQGTTGARPVTRQTASAKSVGWGSEMMGSTPTRNIQKFYHQLS